MCWPLQGPLVVGLADGKIRASFIKNNKASTLYNTDSYVVSLASNNEGTGFLSGHADGSIVRWYVADDEKARPQVMLTKNYCIINSFHFSNPKISITTKEPTNLFHRER